MKNWTYPDTTGWLEFNFSVDGHEFISKVKPNTSIARQIKKVPAQVLNEINKSAVLDCIGEGFTRDEIIAKLVIVNEGASEAVIELA
jgi:hypothetical protein